MTDRTADARPRLTGLQVALLAVLLLALLGSVGYRAYARTDQKGATATPAGAQGFVRDGAAQSAPAATPLERSLPYVTEGSFFGLIGFALGYASRKFVKLALILLALAFVGLQALVWTGSVSVDWSGLVGKLNGLLFNLGDNETFTQFLTRRVPAAGGLLAGYAIGFHRG
jgi:uncharacterized membrane protein (Fun14 family)